MNKAIMAAAQVIPINRPPILGVPMASYNDDRPAWYIRAGIFIGTLMPNDSPKGWGWNPSVITLAILCGSIIAGASWFISDLNSTVRQIKEDTRKATDTAEVAKSIALTGQEPTPTPTPKEKN